MKLSRIVAASFMGAIILSNPTVAAAQSDTGGDVRLEEVPSSVFSGSRKKDILRTQVLLDRARFAPGVIDGLGGGNTRKAIRAFQRSEGVEADGKVDDDLLSRLESRHSGAVLRRYTISEEDAKGPFVDEIPDSLKKQSEMDKLGFTSAEEMLAEKFHMSGKFLRALNPDADFDEAGAEIIVAARRTGGIEGDVKRIEVDKRDNVVRAYGNDDKLLAFYPATVGSESLPSPDGDMTVEAIAFDAAYYFDPEALSWGPDERLKIPPGPNNPVGSTWIDLSEESYGIHGSPDPQLISKTASHGCVRLTNWDVEELAKAVSKGVEVRFVGG